MKLYNIKLNATDDPNAPETLWGSWGNGSQSVSKEKFMSNYKDLTREELEEKLYDAEMTLIEERMEKSFQDYKPRYDEMKEKYNTAKTAYDIAQSKLEDIQDDYKELYAKYILTSRQLEQLLNCFAPKPYYSEGNGGTMVRILFIRGRNNYGT